MHARHVLTGVALAALGLLSLAGPASAHISPSVTSAPAGSSLKFELRVGHGCDEGNTNKIEVQIPEGVNSVTPQVVPGWTVESTIAQLPEAIEGPHGSEITERTSVVTWTGGPLHHHQLEEFGLSVRLPDTPGETIYFPTIQSCDNGASTSWIQIPEEGGEEPESPAPAIALTEVVGDDHDAGDAGMQTEGDASTDDAETASAPADSNDDGDGLAIAALVVGGLGLLVGGAALVRGRSGG